MDSHGIARRKDTLTYTADGPLVQVILISFFCQTSLAIILNPHCRVQAQSSVNLPQEQQDQSVASAATRLPANRNEKVHASSWRARLITEAKRA
jgi:hypothetical protein